MKQILTLFCCVFAFVANTQYNPNRYVESIFSGSSVQADVQYGAAPKWTFPYSNETLKLNVYQPLNDTVTKRPLIIFAHAGGFLNGSKGVDDMVALCDSFARKGYVTATIDYRKGFNPLDGESAERAVYRGIQDGKAAVRFFKQNNATYKIDTNNIFFGGMSAGGYIALHVAYMDKETERPQSTFGGGTVNDLGCLDCAGNTFPHSSKVKGILDFWGALQDTTIIEVGNVPVMIMHGENDPTVPFNVGHPFGLSTLPETYGGLPISIRAQNLGLDYEFYTSTGSLHMLDGSDNGTFPSTGPNAFWSDTLLPRSRDFLYRLVRPTTVRITPAITSHCVGIEKLFEVVNTPGNYYVWTVTSGSNTTAISNTTAQLNMVFQQAGNYTLTVYEYNRLMAASLPVTFTVNVGPALDASFTATSINNLTYSFESNAPTAFGYHWDFGDGTTSLLENPSHIYAQAGTYQVTLTVTGDCEVTTTQTVSTSGLTIEAIADLQLVSIFPNPVSDELTIVNKDQQSLLITVIDPKGRELLKTEMSELSNELKLDVAHWSAGMYIVHVFDNKGNQHSVKILK